MSTFDHRGFPMTERELNAMTRDMVDMHEDLFPRFTAVLTEIAETAREQAERVALLAHGEATRRNFLKGGLVTAGAIGGGLLIAACGSSDNGSPSATAAATTASGASTDLKIARLAASLEILAINTYTAALAAAASGALGVVPKSVGSFSTTAKAQHTEHRDAWNAALTTAGQPAQTAPEPKYDPIVQSKLQTVKSLTDVTNLALLLETIAVETYTSGAGVISDPTARRLALTIAPVEAQHVAILNFVLGNYPVPNTTIPLDMAASPSDLGS